jgi:hypothetical protein
LSSFVKNSGRLWELWRLCKSYHCRPSDIVDTRDAFAAFCLDRAVHTFGLAVEAAIDDATEGKKKAQAQAAAQNVVALWTGAPMKFANPAATR